jgi:sialate O-acetylesterase
MTDTAGTARTGGPDKPWGAFILEGPEDWRILQQDASGNARMPVSGRWAPKESMGLLGAAGGTVEIRLVREETGTPVNASLDWRAVETGSDGTWRGALDLVPAGGPYRLETRFNPKGNKLGEWSLRGDMRHFLGVGDLWIIAGQSNASGYGRAPYDDAPELGLHMLRHNGAWSLASHPLSDATASVFPASRETYNTGHSPFLHFARALKRELRHPIGLLPAALGGSPLADWHPERGALFANLKAMAARAGGSVKGILWYQGETDAEPGKAEDYLARFLESAAGWRKALAQPELPILTVQLARYRSEKPGMEDKEWSLVREAQRQAALRDPRVYAVPALDLPLDDTIHIGTSGNLILGARLAACALGAVYAGKAAEAGKIEAGKTGSMAPMGDRPEWRAPDLAEAVMDGPQMVRLRFAPVLSRLDTLDPGSMPFRVEDDDGAVAIEKILYFHRDSVKLFLAKHPKGTARISCGHGENPDILPVDVERLMPVLAFHGIAVTEATPETPATPANLATA